MQNVKDFGAAGDGKTNDTVALQKAIDAGGTVYLPAGVYISGTLYLKSNGGLLLAPGATIKASHNREDYNALDYCPQNEKCDEEFMVGTHLITAVEQENVFICGHGTIDGDSHFWVNDSLKYSEYDFWGHPTLEAQRPGQMIYFVECTNVQVKDVTLTYAPFWHLFFHGCENVQACGLKIKGETKQWVNDGIDIDCCSRVTVSDCIIETGDDAITLRANGKKTKRKVCEDITITNCILTSYLDYGIRIGVGGGVIRNALFSNIIIKDSLYGMGMTCRFSPQGDCASVENIRFDNISVKALRAFEMKLSDQPNHPPLKSPAYIKNVSMSNFYIESNRYCILQGFENGMVSGLRFFAGQIKFIQEDENNDRHACNYYSRAINEKDAAIYLEKIDGAVFDGVEIDRGPFAKAIIYDEAENVRFCERWEKI